MQEESETKKEEIKELPKLDYINIEDFSKIKLKTGIILAWEIVPGADKLYKFTVDVGEESGPRTILSGIREFFPDGDVFINKQVVVVSNLAPRKIRGVESNGMLLFAGGDIGKLHMITPQDNPSPGTTVR